MVDMLDSFDIIPQPVVIWILVIEINNRIWKADDVDIVSMLNTWKLEW